MRAEAEAEADDATQVQQRLQRERAGQLERLAVARRSERRAAVGRRPSCAQRPRRRRARSPTTTSVVAERPVARVRPRRRENGAAAISAGRAAGRRRRPSARSGAAAWPPSTGAIAKASVESAATKKPPQSSRSRRRPSTEKRDRGEHRDERRGERTAVSRTSRSCGSVLGVCAALGYATKSARPAPSSPTSRISPQSQAW